MTCFSDLESLPGLPGTRWHLSVLPTPLARGASISDRLTRSVARSALPVGIRYSATQSGKTKGEGVPLHFYLINLIWHSLLQVIDIAQCVPESLAVLPGSLEVPPEYLATAAWRSEAAVLVLWPSESGPHDLLQ